MLDKKNSKERKSFSTCSKFLGFNDFILNKKLELHSQYPLPLGKSWYLGS